MAEPILNLKDFSVERLGEHFRADGFESYRAEQVASWIYGRGVEDPSAMTDLSRALREKLTTQWNLRSLVLADLVYSKDGTAKGLFRTTDGAFVEAVLIPEEGRFTLCVSTQVGCPLACSFCATGAMGFVRNLTTAEIVDQVCQMRGALPSGRSLTNVVFMGMGEPLLNSRAVIESIRLLIHPKAFALAPRRITVSTAGIVPQMAPLLEAVPVSLAVSLHSPRDEVRDVLVPLNRRFPLSVLMDALRALPGLSKRRPVFFEYTLMEGVNDSEDDARAVLARVRGIPCKLNLIPMNAHPDSPHRPPSSQIVEAFQTTLLAGGLRVTLRRPRGADIEAACGQLAARRRS